MTTTSRENAEALFELAAQDSLTAETSQGLETVESALLQQPGYRALLASPAIPKAERLEALDAVLHPEAAEYSAVSICPPLTGWSGITTNCPGISGESPWPL